MAEAPKRENGLQGLTRGLQILRMLIDEHAPLTSVEIGRRVGLHQSSASRILATLAEQGYVRRTPAGFVPDYGVLTLAAATQSFPLSTTPRPVLEATAAANPGFLVNLCALWRGQMLYLLRAADGAETITFWWSNVAMNASSAAMRILLDLPEDEALAIMTASRERVGWQSGTAAPATPESALATARDLLEADTLVLQNWAPHSISGALPVDHAGTSPLVLAIAAPAESINADKLRLLLYQTRRQLEPLLS